MGATGNCPSTTFYQVPGQPDLFLGRTVADPTTCAGGPLRWTLALYKMDWANLTFHFVNTLLDVPTTTPSGIELRAALDPTAAEYRGEVWVAFECVPVGIGDTSSCVAPLDVRTGQLDMSRVSLPVRGTKSAFSAERFSASVPKLFADNGRLYIYWTVVDHMPRTADSAASFRSVSARGAELVESAAGVLQVAGAPGGYVGSVDPRGSVAVLHWRANDPTADSVADIFDVREVNGRILVAVAVGGSGSSPDEERCVRPTNNSRGCYHLEIHQAVTPLGDGAFDRQLSGETDLPYNPANYAHFIDEPGEKVGLIVHFFGAVNQDQTHQYARYASPSLAILTTSALR
jgi:hypothetical protein